MASSLLLPVGGPAVTVKVHPVVLLQVCDAYIRRNEKQDRVIGTLLGVVSDGQVHVNRSYAVPHNESADQVAVDIMHHKTMFELHQRVAPSETIVGWFSTGSSITSSDALIQDFYSKEAANPRTHVHLVVDTTLKRDRVTVTAYVSRVLALGDKALATEFIEVPCEVPYADVERVGVDLLVSGSTTVNKPLAEQEGLGSSVRRLHALVAQAKAYVDDVVAGRTKGDPAIGRYLADTLAVVPHLEAADFERLFNDGVQDALLLEYLAQLVRSQVSLAERLGTSALPIL